MNSPKLLDEISKKKISLDKCLPEDREGIQKEIDAMVLQLADIAKKPLESAYRMANFWYVNYVDRLCTTAEGHEQLKLTPENK